MVDLPTVPDRIVTTTAPQSSVSRRDIIGNTDAMAGALSKVADATMDIATRQAREQAASDLQQQKVVRNDDGSVSVVNPANSLIFGRAGEQYHAAVAAGTIAQHSNIISTEMNDLHQQYSTDPAAFKSAADAWKAKYLADHGGGEVGLAISQQADQLQTQHYNSITNAAGKNDLATQDSSLSAMQTSARNDVLAMLRNGADINDKAVQSRIAQFDSAIAARAANPLFAYSKEQAQLDRDTFHSEAAGSRFLYNNDQIYQDQGDKGGRNAALNHAKDILSNPNYQLSPQQRDKFYHAAVAQIRANEAIRHQDISEARAAASELKFEWQAGGVSSDQVERVAKGFEAAGDPGGAASLRASFLRKPLIDDHGNQPLATQTQQLMGLQGMNAVRGDVQYLIGKGYSPQAAAAIGSHILHESDGNPSRYTPNDAGTGPSAGLAQFHNERLTSLKQFAAAQGKPWTDRGTQLDFIDRELHTTEAGTLAKLQASKTPEEAAAAFYGYERPAGYNIRTGDATGTRDYSSRLNTARQIFGGDPGVSMGPAGSAWLIAHRQIALGDAATTQWKTIMDDYKKEGTRPSVKTVIDVDNAASASGNGALHDQIADDSKRMDISGEFGTTSLPSQHADLAAMKAAGERGDLPPALAALQKDLQRRTDAITKGLSDNPIATAAANLPNQIKEQPPLDWSSDQSVVAGLKARGQIAKIAERNWESGGALSALDSADVAQMQGMLANPDPAVKGRVFNALSTLPEDVRNATLAKIGKDRPDLMVSVAAGSMMKAAPDVATSIMRGQAAINSKLGYLPTGEKLTDFEKQFDERVPASTFGLAARTDPSGPYATGLGMVKARYADLSAQSADTKGNVDKVRLQQAVDDVTGGILDHNGGKLIAPVRGMPKAVFDRTMYGLTDNDLRGVSTLNGQPVDANYLRNNATLESVGDGRYYVKLGKDPMKPVYAYQGANTESPQKFMLDLRNRPQGVAPVSTAFLP